MRRKPVSESRSIFLAAAREARVALPDVVPLDDEGLTAGEAVGELAVREDRVSGSSRRRARGSSGFNGESKDNHVQGGARPTLDDYDHTTK